MPHKRHLFCLHVCDISRISAYIFLWHETCYRQLIFLRDASRYSAVRKSKKAFAFLDCRAFALSAKIASKCFAMAFASHYPAVRKSKKAFAFLDCRAFALSAKIVAKCFVQAQHFATIFAGTAHLDHIVPDFILEYYFSICSEVCPLVEECIIESFFAFLNGIKFCT